MIEPSLAKYVIALLVLAGIGMLFQLGQAILDPEEFQRQREEERERRRRVKRFEKRLRLGCLFVVACFFGLALVGQGVSMLLDRGAPTSAGSTRYSRVRAPPASTVPEAPPVEPLVEGRPAHLLGRMADGCRLLSLQEATAQLGLPLKYDAFSLLLQRDEALHCAFVDPSARTPQRSRQEVSLEVLHWPGEGPADASANIAFREKDLNWMFHDVDEGVSVRVPTGRSLFLWVRVSLRHLKRQPGKRTKAEQEAARRIARFVHNRVANLPVEAVSPVRHPLGPGPVAGAWFPESSEDVVWQKAPSTRTRYALLEALYTLRARFGTRVQVVVLDDKADEDVEPEVLLRALEQALAAGRADTSPRRDGALVLIDPATRQAWCSFGLTAPPLLSGKRPFPTEWKGKDLSLQGPGIARRLQALTAAYTRAYGKLGVDGPPALAAAPP